MDLFLHTERWVQTDANLEGKRDDLLRQLAEAIDRAATLEPDEEEQSKLLISSLYDRLWALGQPSEVLDDHLELRAALLKEREGLLNRLLAPVLPPSELIAVAEELERTAANPDDHDEASWEAYVASSMNLIASKLRTWGSKGCSLRAFVM